MVLKINLHYISNQTSLTGMYYECYNNNERLANWSDGEITTLVDYVMSKDIETIRTLNLPFTMNDLVLDDMAYKAIIHTNEFIFLLASRGFDPHLCVDIMTGFSQQGIGAVMSRAFEKVGFGNRPINLGIDTLLTQYLKNVSEIPTFSLKATMSQREVHELVRAARHDIKSRTHKVWFLNNLAYLAYHYKAKCFPLNTYREINDIVLEYCKTDNESVKTILRSENLPYVLSYINDCLIDEPDKLKKLIVRNRLPTYPEILTIFKTD